MNGRNIAILTGHLGTEPQERKFDNGGNVTRFRMATNQRYRGPDGEDKDRTDWHTVNAWGRTGEFCAKTLGKGDSVQVIRTIRHDVIGEAGAKKYFTTIRAWEVNLLSRRSPDNTHEQRPDTSTKGNRNSSNEQSANQRSFSDPLPF